MKYIKYQILSDSASQWVDWCKREVYKLNSTHKPGSTQRKFYQFPGGVLAELIINDVYDTVRVWGGGGIVCHPRSQNEVNTYVIPAGLYGQPAMDVIAIDGGWTTNEDGVFTELTTSYAYPLVDADNASFLLSGDTAVDTGEFLGTEGNYGNIYWHNDNIAALSIISYKGIPTRHFMLTQQDTINGADFAIDGQGYIIYKDGVALTNTRNGADGNPEAICGAAELDGEIICCTSSGVSIYQGGEWVNIPIAGWESASAWFFDSTGKKAVNSSGTHILIFTKSDDGIVSGTLTVNYVPSVDNLIHFTVSQTDKATTYNFVAPEAVVGSCFELKATGEVANLSAVSSLSIKSEYFHSSAITFADYVVYDDAVEYTVYLSYDGIDTVCAILRNPDGSPASPPGLACGPLTYSFSGAAQIGSTACAIVDPSIACCHDAEVVNAGVTITGPGVSAAGSISITTVAKAGSWVRTASNLKSLHYAHTSDPSGCTVGTYTDDTDNAYYLTNGPPVDASIYSTSYSVCGGTKTVTYSQGALIKIDEDPGGCYNAGPNVTTAQNIDIISVGAKTAPAGGTCFTYPPCGPCWCVYWASTWTATKNIGTQTYTWVCT